MPIPTAEPATHDARLTALRAAVAEVVALAQDEEALRGLSSSELLEMLAEVTGSAGRLQAVQVVVAERVEATDASFATGWASTRDLLTHLMGGRKGSGGGVLRLAEHTASLPDVRAGMLAGDVSPAQARTIGRRTATLPNDPAFRAEAAGVMLDQIADSGLDATDLDRAFDDVLAVVDPDGSIRYDERQRAPQERSAHRARHLSLVPDEVGGVSITGYAGVEDAELISTTLAPLAAPRPSEPGSCGGQPGLEWLERHLRTQAGDPAPTCPDPACDHDGRDPRDHGARLLDALVEVCRRAQATDAGPEALPRAHGTTARITVTIDHDDLRTQTGTGLLGSGQCLTVAAVRRLACDAEILPAVLGSGGQVLDLGRSQRLVSPSIWLGLVLRDRHCVFPGCTRPPQACQAHHIRHWADGGPTSLDNLALLCGHHHRLTHHSPWVLSLDPVARRPVWQPPPRKDQPLGGRLGPPVPRDPVPLGVPA